jgi:site-specific DNA-methyltransferase (adenine-specific)
MLLGRGKYQWAHEPCVFGVKGSPYFTSDRTKTTVWDFGGYDKSKNVHPTQKPIILCEEAINNSSKPGFAVLDLFLGSGSTLIACEKTGRHCYGMEISPQYVDIIIKRWQDFTGKKAVREDGIEFDAL